MVLPDGRAFAGDDVIDHFQRQPGLSFCRLVQKSASRFLLEVAPDGHDSANLDDARLSKNFGNFLGADVSVIARRVRRIAPEPSGKYRLVISTTYMQLHVTEMKRQGIGLNVA